MFWYEFENENACTCQNMDWFQFWRLNMEINAKKTTNEVNQSNRTCFFVVT